MKYSDMRSSVAAQKYAPGLGSKLSVNPEVERFHIRQVRQEILSKLGIQMEQLRQRGVLLQAQHTLHQILLQTSWHLSLEKVHCYVV
jgi:hypothetical protein